MNITFAFALNNDGIFEKKHFGDSDKFAIYTYKNHELIFHTEFQNTYKNLDGFNDHGSTQKGQAIISLLKENGVSVLVSKQFGHNIKLVNQHFIPAIIDEDIPEKVHEILKKNFDWFKDELINRNENYMLFKIKSGIIKMHI